MILKVSQKVNNCGWRKQLIIDFENKTITAGAFLFHSGDVEKLTATQYKQLVNYCKYNDFKFLEG
jgi:hypothetical protein